MYKNKTFIFYKNMMKQWWGNFMKIFTDSVAWGTGLLGLVITVWLGWYFSDLDLTKGNMGGTYAYGELVLYGIFVIAFVVFISATIYQIRYFSQFETEEKKNKKTGILGGIGSFFSILVVWCPACSITLASYIWLASLMSLLPWNGMELKILGAWLVIWSAWSTVNKLETCQMKIWWKKQNVLFAYFRNMNISKILVILVALAWIATSVRAIKDYQQAKTTSANTASVVAELPTDTAPSDDVYVPQPNQWWACDGWWGCGCGN